MPISFLTVSSKGRVLVQEPPSSQGKGAGVIAQTSDCDGASVVGGGGLTILTSFPFSSASNTSHLILTYVQVMQAEANLT